MRARHPFVVVIAAGLMLGLSACAPERSLEGESSTPPTSSAPSESATPEAPEEVDDGATPVTQTCEELVSAQTIYDYNPNFSLTTEGSAGNGGVRCVWVNQSSGDEIVLTVSRPSEEKLAELRTTAAESSTPAPALGSEAYFDLANATGTATIFADGHVIVISSPFFLEAAEAQPLIESAVGGLGL